MSSEGRCVLSKDYLLCISAVFNLFCSFQTLFSDFKPEINKKHLKKNKIIPYDNYNHEQLCYGYQESIRRKTTRTFTDQNIANSLTNKITLIYLLSTCH